ncbi:MAG: hypothetical protein KJ792_04845 [Actinobacteria bacterium]|nr:hypothetical protein [Actinomycetota bacterium]MCG2801827.1 hypothetical protein [Cellulomonas sp.]
MSAPSTVLRAREVRAQVLAEVDARRVEHQRAEVAAKVRALSLQEEADRLRAQWAADCQVARAKHAPLPPAPLLPDDGGITELMHRLMGERADLFEAQCAALAGGAPVVEAAWQRARAGLDARAVALLGQVEGLAAEYQQWWDLVHETRSAVERADPNVRPVDPPSGRMRRVDVAAVLAAGAGADVCTPGPALISRAPDAVGQSAGVIRW